MKIVSVNVVAFGKLNNVNLNFADGINLLQQSNGFGKSTLCAFIRAMLYGLNYSYKTVEGVRANDVTRYMPWNSSQKFGGSMQVCHEGKNYRIERFFGNTSRAESLQVVDLSTGKQLDIANVGEYFLGLTAESYDRSTYLPQEYVEIASNENFDSKLANLVQDSAQNYDAIQTKLRNYKRTFKLERGNGGTIYALESEVFGLQNALRQAQNDAHERVRMTKKLQDVEEQLQSLQKEQTSLQKTADELQQQLYQSKPTSADVELAQKIDELDAKISAVPTTVEDDYQTFNQQLSQKDALEKGLKSLAFTKKIFAVSSIIALLFAVIMAVLKNYMPAMAGAGVLVAIIVSAVCVSKISAKTVGQKIEDIDGQLTTIVSKYINPNGKTHQQLKDEFWKYLNDYQTNVNVRKALGNRPIIKDDQSQVEFRLQQVKLRMQNVALQQQNLVKTQHQLAFTLAQPTSSAVDIAEELLAKQQLLQQAKHKYEVADKTAEILAQAKESLSSAYLPELCLRTERLLNTVTNGTYKVVTDRNFAISLQQNGQTKPLSAFSRGIREITLLCFRVALSQLLYGKDIPLLIVDDAFVNFDEQNFARATELLKQLSQTTQIIYFTCHNRTGNF